MNNTILGLMLISPVVVPVIILIFVWIHKNFKTKEDYFVLFFILLLTTSFCWGLILLEGGK